MRCFLDCKKLLILSLDNLMGSHAFLKVYLSRNTFLLYSDKNIFTFQKIPPLETLLSNATEQLEYHRGILARLNPRYIQKFVIPAAEHAEHISKQALYLSKYDTILDYYYL